MKQGCTINDAKDAGMKMTRFQYMLAPMEGLTDNAFRRLCFDHGADVTFTEMTRIDGLARKNKVTLKRIEILDDTPTVIQLIGSKEQNLEKFLKRFEPQNGFKGFNLNIGCSSPDMVNAGLGAAMIKRVSKVNKLMKIIQEHGFETSVKMRLGLNKYEKEKKAYLNLINNVDAEFFVVHARTADENYEDEPDNSVYKECVKTGKVIIANGGITTKEDIEALREIGMNGAMIGTAALSRPDIFDVLKGKKEIDKKIIVEEYLKLCERFNTGNKYKKKVIAEIGR